MSKTFQNIRSVIQRPIEPIKCRSCGARILGPNEFWTITKHYKEPTTFPCPQCKAAISAEYSRTTQTLFIKKICSCDLGLTDMFLEDMKTARKWKSKHYYYCTKCFTSTQPLTNVALSDILGDTK